MTVAAAYLTSEGVVLGADSATTVQAGIPGGGQGGVVQILRHTQKVFEVGQNSRLGVCTWGSGNVANLSHRTVVAILADRIKPETTVTEAAEELKKLVIKTLEAAKVDTGSIGYFIGGWNPGNHSPQCFKLIFEPNKEPFQGELSMGGAEFTGAPHFFTRVFRGHDPQLQQRLFDQLVSKIQPLPDGFKKVFDESYLAATTPLIAEGYHDLPIREAIDFIHFYLRLTVKGFKFSFGVPVCGGPIEVAFISTDRHFRWVCHKDFDSAITEEDVHSRKYDNE